MVRALCGLHRPPGLDASDALAVAICHVFRQAFRGSR
jgi:Holliday junction resolvasome RuvABC endonuclease subunit